MRQLFGLVLIAGLGLAGFAVYMAQNYIGAYEAALQKERAKTGQAIPTHQIFVATRAIESGAPINPEDFRLAAWTVDTLPEKFFDAKTPIYAKGDKPRVALRRIEKNEAFMHGKISKPGGSARLTNMLEPGQSAFALRVDVASGVSGLLHPGDYVDVYWTGSVGRELSETRGEITQRIQSGVRLIAIDQQSTTDFEGAIIARTVTVAASPQAIAALAQAQSTGKLYLSLTTKPIDANNEVIEIDQRGLLGIENNAQAVVEAEKPQGCFTAVTKGVERIQVPIPCPQTN